MNAVTDERSPEDYRDPDVRRFAMLQFGACWSAVTTAKAVAELFDFDGFTASLEVADYLLTCWGESLSVTSDSDVFEAVFRDLCNCIEIAIKLHQDMHGDDTRFLLFTASGAIERARFQTHKSIHQWNATRVLLRSTP